MSSEKKMKRAATKYCMHLKKIITEAWEREHDYMELVRKGKVKFRGIMGLICSKKKKNIKRIAGGYKNLVEKWWDRYVWLIVGVFIGFLLGMLVKSISMYH